MSSRIGVDIGGTFTDFILYDEIGNTVTIDKITTTPDSPERAVIDVIKKNLTRAGDVLSILVIVIVKIGIYLYPIMPNVSESIFQNIFRTYMLAVQMRLTNVVRKKKMLLEFQRASLIRIKAE